jgi:hypothetical protein
LRQKIIFDLDLDQDHFKNKFDLDRILDPFCDDDLDRILNHFKNDFPMSAILDKEQNDDMVCT